MDAKQSFYELVIDKKGSTDDKIAYYNEWSKEFDKVNYFYLSHFDFKEERTCKSSQYLYLW